MVHFLLSLLLLNAFYHMGCFFELCFLSKKSKNGILEKIVWGMTIAVMLQFILLRLFSYPNPFVYYFWNAVVSGIALLSLVYLLKNRSIFINKFFSYIRKKYEALIYHIVFVLAAAFVFFFHIGFLVFKKGGYFGWKFDYMDYFGNTLDTLMGLGATLRHVGFDLYSSISQAYFDSYVTDFKFTYFASSLVLGVLLFLTIRKYFLTLKFNLRTSSYLSFLAYFWGPILLITAPILYASYRGYFFTGFQSSYWNPSFTLSMIYLIFCIIYFIQKRHLASATFLTLSFFMKPSGFFVLAPFFFLFYLYKLYREKKLTHFYSLLILLFPIAYYKLTSFLLSATGLLRVGKAKGEGGILINPFDVWLVRMKDTLLADYSVSQVVLITFILSFAGVILIGIIKKLNWNDLKECEHKELYLILGVSFIWAMISFFLFQQNTRSMYFPNFKWGQGHVSALLIPLLFYEIYRFYGLLQKKTTIKKILLFMATILIVGFHIASGFFHFITVAGGSLY